VSPPAAIPTAELQRLFEGLGFHTHPLSFNTAIPDPELRKALTDGYSQSAASRLLRNLPDLFVLHPTMACGIFFVKLSAQLSSEERQAFKEFYPRDVLLVSIAEGKGKRSVVCRWIDQTAQKPLLTALKERFKFTPPALSVKAVAKLGWEL